MTACPWRNCDGGHLPAPHGSPPPCADRCGGDAIFVFGSGESEDPTPIPLCLTHSILLQLALGLLWSD